MVLLKKISNLRVVFQLLLLLLFETTQLLRLVRTKSQHLMSLWSNKSRLHQHLQWLSTFSTKATTSTRWTCWKLLCSRSSSTQGHPHDEVMLHTGQVNTLSQWPTTTHTHTREQLLQPDMHYGRKLECLKRTHTDFRDMQTSHRKAPGWGIQPRTLCSSFLMIVSSWLLPCFLPSLLGCALWQNKEDKHSFWLDIICISWMKKTDEITKGETFGPHVVLSYMTLSFSP